MNLTTISLTPLKSTRAIVVKNNLCLGGLIVSNIPVSKKVYANRSFSNEVGAWKLKKLKTNV